MNIERKGVSRLVVGISCFAYKPTKAGKYKTEITPRHGPNKMASKKATFNVKVK